MSQRRTQKRAEATPSRKAADRPSGRLKTLPIVALGLLLAVGTMALYSPVRGHDFINYDDDRYVVSNSHVRMGLTWETVRWAFTSREYDNWHPVTWLSHAADCEFFGLDPGSQHLINALIHALNALLLFVLLVSATRLTGPSFVVAALFACHPWNVESVAWISERKNLLCTLFVFVSFAAYGWYARKPGVKRMALVSALFFLALAAKPMAVTLPFVLLLIDYWPLGRIAGRTRALPIASLPKQSVSRLLIEKWPLFLLTIASSAVTVWAQSTQALRSMQAFPLSGRIENALYSYLVYIARTFWPQHFALFYPAANSSMLVKAALAAVFLAVISVLAWTQRQKRPYLIVGWLFFLGVLFSMIGIVQVGEQAMADRYAYLSTIGLFVMAVWAGSEGLKRLHVGNKVQCGMVVMMLSVLCLITSRQISYWKNSVSIWSHVLDVTGVNLLGERKLAFALIEQGDDEAAGRHFIRAVNLDPKDVVSRVNLGAYHMSRGRLEDALQDFQIAVALTNDRTNLSSEDREHRGSALMDLGFVYLLLNNYPQALVNIQSANQVNPSLVNRVETSIQRSLANVPSEDNCLKMSLLLRAQDRNQEALSFLQSAVRSNPEYSRATNLLNFLAANNK